MTKAELIEKLEDVPDDAEIVVHFCDNELVIEDVSYYWFDRDERCYLACLKTDTNIMALECFECEKSFQR